MNGEYQFIPNEKVEEYLKKGWISFGPMPGPHGYWRTLMKAPEKKRKNKDDDLVHI
jgi:hypothetical protein